MEYLLRGPSNLTPARYSAVASAENRDAFVADPTAWKIVDGRLYVNYNASVQKSWNADAAALIRRGDVRWSKIFAKSPKELKQ